MLNLSFLTPLRTAFRRQLSTWLALLIALASPVVAATWSLPSSGVSEALRWVWGADQNNVWIVGGTSSSTSTILKWNGSTFSTQSSPVSKNLHSVFGFSATDVWASGRDGTILHYNGTSWSSQPAAGVSTGYFVYAIWGADTNNVWAAAYDGTTSFKSTILKWNGSAWSAQATGVDAMFRSIWGSSTTDVWAVGAATSGTAALVYHFNGTSWSSVTIPSVTTLFAVWGIDANNVWAVGAASSGTHSSLIKWDGTSWSNFSVTGLPGKTTTGTLRGITGTSANNIYIVSDTNGFASRWDGTTWTTETTGTSNSFNGLWINSDGTRLVASSGAGGVVATGVASAANTAPTISDVTNQSVAAGVSTGALAITIGDTETPVASLTMSGSSSNTTLVPNANIVFGGSGANRTVTVTPAAGQSGTATITLTVTDGGSATASDTFVLTVTADTTRPTVLSVVRTGSASSNLAAGTTSASFTVTYSEPVTGVIAANFVVEAVTGNVTGTVGTVTGSGAVYTVPVTITSGSGEFRLKVIN